MKHQSFDTKQKPRLSPLKSLTPLMLNRKLFLQLLAAFGVVAPFPLLALKNAKSQSTFKPHSKPDDLLSDWQRSILSSVQAILFPSDGNGPGAGEINAQLYLQWVLTDPQLEVEDKNYILNGIEWVNETALESYAVDYLELSPDQQKELVRKITAEDWGASWLSILLTYILEALLADPLYGGNTDESGWKWLEHYPGYPRPTKQTIYANINNTIGLKP